MSNFAHYTSLFCMGLFWQEASSPPSLMCNCMPLFCHVIGWDLIMFCLFCLNQ